MRTRTNDIDTAWFEVGRGDPVILIHGLGDDHRAWRRVVPELALEHRVVLYDFRGHGQTQLGEADGTLTQLSGDLVSLMDALELESAMVAGFSLGGTIAMRAAIDHPRRVRELALIGTSSRVGGAAAQWYRERAEMIAAHDPSLRETLDHDTEDVYRNRPEEIEPGLLIRRQSTADPSGYANACLAMASLREHPLDPELGRIAAPATIVAGEKDQHCPPKAAQIIADGIPDSTLEILADTGHPIPIERPAEVASAIGAVHRPRATA
ncbi:MAG: alpha/beta fold hydrolase [Solirubrobacterales bacterium]|nr:alpha/beta fold hydrolase [Solirubrobacterales bacterium]